MDQVGHPSSLPLTAVEIGQEIMTAKGIRLALMFLGSIFDFHLFKTHHKMWTYFETEFKEIFPGLHFMQTSLNFTTIYVFV